MVHLTFFDRRRTTFGSVLADPSVWVLPSEIRSFDKSMTVFQDLRLFEMSVETPKLHCREQYLNRPLFV